MGEELPARSLSNKCDLDPCHDWIVELLKGAYEGTPPTWPTRSKGMQALLKSDRLLSEISKEQAKHGRPSAALDLHEALSRQLTRQADAPRTAIQVHTELDGLISAAQAVICTYEWFLEPSSAVFVCAGPVEAAAIEALLRQDDDIERGEDLLAASQRVAEELAPPVPGWHYSGPSPVLLVDQVMPGDSWREVFLSPGCRGLRADQLLPIVGGAQVGLHVLSIS
jgi:hypothetical protein